MSHITDTEYAVLQEICRYETTSLDRLKMMFYGSAVPAVKALEDYDLIRACFPPNGCYYATAAGKAYKHSSAHMLRQPNNISKKDQRINQNPEKTFYKSPLFWTIIGLASSTVIGVIQIFQR